MSNSSIGHSHIFKGKHASISVGGIPVQCIHSVKVSIKVEHETPYDHPFEQSGDKLIIKGHSNVRWIDLDKMVALIDKYEYNYIGTLKEVKPTYKRVVVHADRKLLEVIGMPVQTLFGHRVYEAYERKIGSMVVE